MTCLGCQRCEVEADTVTLRDGRVVCNTCEGWRHECECMDVVKRHYPDGGAINAHFAEIEKKRGKEAADRLRNDCREFWAERHAAR